MPETTTGVDFKFCRFNNRRAMRGAESVQIELIEDGESYGPLWMSLSDIKANIKEFGEYPVLTRGLECYKTRKDPGESN